MTGQRPLTPHSEVRAALDRLPATDPADWLELAYDAVQARPTDEANRMEGERGRWRDVLETMVCGGGDPQVAHRAMLARPPSMEAA